MALLLIYFYVSYYKSPQILLENICIIKSKVSFNLWLYRFGAIKFGEKKQELTNFFETVIKNTIVTCKDQA